MQIKDSSTVMKIIERSRLLQLKDFEIAKELSEQYPVGQDFLKALLKKKMVTRWQAGQLLSGNTSFFLGKYKLVDLLGAGGMGRVFRAEHITMNRPVALKIIAKELVTDPEAQKRFLNEARAIAALNHPNIVHAYSVDKEGDRYYIVMEYVDGADLEKIIEKNGPMAQDRVALYMYQAASALNHAHERGMIHCDIKPANLLLNQESDQIKILDMGLARFHSRSESGSIVMNTEDLHKNVIGTVDYMAPEVAEDSVNSSPRSDIYSLGCVMYFLLTGSIPFPADTIPERIIKHQSEEPKNPQDFNDRISSRLSAICLKMMAKKPEDRYASCAEIEEELTQWLSESSQAGESTVSLDFTNFGSDSKASRSSSLNQGSRSKKSSFFSKFSKKDPKEAKDSKTSKEVKENAEMSGKLSSASGISNLEKREDDFSRKKETEISFLPVAEASGTEITKNKKEEKTADETIVASEKEMAEAAAQDPVFETKNMEKKENIQNTHPAKNSKLVQAVLLDDEDDEDVEESFVVVKKAPVSQKTSVPPVKKKPVKADSARDAEISAVMSRLHKGKSSAWGSGKREEKVETPVSAKNAAPKKESAGAKKATANAFAVKMQEIIQKSKTFVSKLTPKQRLIYGGSAGGVLLLLLILILVLCLSGDKDEKKTAQKTEAPVADAIVDDEIVEDDVSGETNTKKADGEAEDSADGEKKADGEAAAPADGEKKADGEAAAPADGEKKADGEAAAPADGEKKADGEATAPADGEKKADGEAAAPADGEKKADGEAAAPADSEKKADGEATAPADGEKKADGEAAAPADGEKKADGEAAAPADGEKKTDGEAAAPADGEKKTDGEAAAPADGEKKADGEAAAPADDAKKADDEAPKKEEPAAEAKPEPKKAAAEPFQNVPEIAPIPKSDSKEKTKLVDLPDAGSEVIITLLGGDVVFPVKTSGKKQAEQTKFFTIEEGDAEGNNKAWNIKYKNKEDEGQAAILSLEDGVLNFQWQADEKIAPKDLPILANCALKLEVGEKSHVLALRQPIELPTITLDPKKGTGSFKGGKIDPPFPSNDVIYVAFTRIGDFPADSTDFTLPEPTKVSDLSPKNPMKIVFNFKDSNGNMQEAFFFDFVPTFGANLTGSLTAGKTGISKGAGQQIMAQITSMQNPEIDIQVTQWQTEMKNLETKMEKQEAWQRNAADTNKISQLQMQIWLVGVAKQMATADFEYRIYAQYGEEQIDLVTSRKMSADEMKPARKGKASKKKSGDDEAAEDENDLGGMKF